jgi:Lipocalin-like domain
MQRGNVFNFPAFVLFGLVLLPGALVAQQKPLTEQLVGTWTYVSSNAKLADGSPLWGQNPKGLFIITADGHFSWQVFRSDRPNFSDRLKATPDEYKTTMLGSLAYFGTYSVNEAEQMVTFHTEGSTFPHSEGETLKRIITNLNEDELVYTNPATTTGAQIEAVWKRLK